MEIIWVLPGNTAKRFRIQCANYICRILGADESLIREIQVKKSQISSSQKDFFLGLESSDAIPLDLALLPKKPETKKQKRIFPKEEREYHRKRQCALQGGRQWSLNFEEWSKLTCQPCIYCGRKRNTNGKSNGLDRVNNKLEYTIDNVVPACWNCNKMKGTLSVRQFAEQATAIAHNLKDFQLDDNLERTLNSIYLKH